MGMRYWLESLGRFLSFAFNPLRHIETLWGWLELVMMWLLLIGIIVTPIIGLLQGWLNWPLFTVLLVAILFLCAGVRLQYRLLRARFYLKIWGLSYRLLSNPLEPKEPFKMSISFEITIANQQDKPRGISKFKLEVQTKDGIKKELNPMNLDNEKEAEITLYLQPHEPKTIRLNFVLNEEQNSGSEKLYVFDDNGAWCRVPINIDTMVAMSKKSKSRSGDYQIE